MSIKEYKLYYKYKENPYVLYDRTRIASWAVSQYEQMRKEYPGASYIVEPIPKELKGKV